MEKIIQTMVKQKRNSFVFMKQFQKCTKIEKKTREKLAKKTRNA